MKNNKVIRGKPLYLYKNSQYLEMPEGCIVKKVEYDEATNKSVVYCGRPSKLLEIICSLVIILCILLNVLYLHSLSYTVRYSSLATYYDNQLFLNVYNDKGNSGSVDVTLRDGDIVLYECTLNPDEYLISVPLENVELHYTLDIEYHTLIKTISESVPISVSIRQ